MTAITLAAAAVASIVDVSLLWPNWAGAFHAAHQSAGGYLAATTATSVLAPIAAGTARRSPLARSVLLAVGVAGNTAVAIRAVPFRSTLALGVALALAVALEATPNWRSTPGRVGSILAGGAVGILPLLLV